MAVTTSDPLSEVLVQAKLSLDSALARMEAGEEPGTLTEAQVKQLTPAGTVNTGCNTGCTTKPK